MSQSTSSEEKSFNKNAGASTPGVIVSLKNVSKVYRRGIQRIEALKNVSLDIFDKDFITIQGPSGCGKSTLLNMMGTMDRPTSGEIVIRDVKVNDLTDDEQADFRAKHVGFVFQFYNLINHLSALGNVSIAVGAAGDVKDPKEQDEMARKVLEKVGLERRLNNKPEELSGGEQQRVAIARAMVNKPTIIIADEPTGDLDTQTGEKIIKLLKELNDEGNAIVIVTHDDKIAKVGKRKIKMEDYEIISDL